MTDIIALLDANVVYPVSLCDALLRCALAGLYRPLWSAEILAELVRNLVADGRSTQERAERRAQHMRQAFPQAKVRGYEGLVSGLTCDEKDRHVLAAAIQGKAQLIITQNLTDFPVSALEPFSILAQHPDRFLQDLLAQDTAAVVRTVREQAAALRHPPMTVEQVLDALSVHAPGFSLLVRAALTSGTTE
jgi:hypothetical protein